MVLSLKTWKSRSLPGLPRTNILIAMIDLKSRRLGNRRRFFSFRDHALVFFLRLPCRLQRGDAAAERLGFFGEQPAALRCSAPSAKSAAGCRAEASSILMSIARMVGTPRPMSEPVIELTVVVPCFNERDNIESLVDRLELVLAGIAWEVTFVDDDSTDGTIEVLRAIAGRNSRVRAIQRIGRRGLASADWPAPASRAACRRRRAFSP